MASGEARVWVADPQEADHVARLLIAFRDWYGRNEPPNAAFASGVRRLIADPAAEFLLAAAESQPPGGVCQLRFRHSLWTAAEDCWLEDLFVDADYRRKGLGEALARAAVDRARERGCGRIELDVSESNRGAWALYERIGFSPGYKPPAPNVLMGLRLR